MKKAHKPIKWENTLNTSTIDLNNLRAITIGEINDRVDDNRYTRLEPMICERCGGTINPETLKCEHCGTYYREVEK